MRRYIASSPKFGGEIHIVYNDNNRLATLDFLPAELSDEQIAYFTRAMPVIFDPAFMKGFPSSELMFIEEGFEVTFEMFWAKYALKLNPDRCLTLWKKLSQSEKVAAYFGINAYDRHLRKYTWKSKANPQTYLRDKYWKNEWQ